MTIPEGFPSDELISDGQTRLRRAGVNLDAGVQAEKFRNHAAQNDRRCSDWAAAWRNWIIAAIERSPKAEKANPVVERPRFSGPAEVRQAVARAGGEDLALGFLDRCTWRDLPDRAVIAPNGFIADRLMRDADLAFRGLGIRVLAA